ncbi:MAG: hypothetical protein A2064_02780 [Spirochaetes bacterium GWB1_66_5]|nr:MAG: hypothetical protein A2064_02780 [Spirochaetes bacterium GWB1_66_5]
MSSLISPRPWPLLPSTKVKMNWQQMPPLTSADSALLGDGESTPSGCTAIFANGWSSSASRFCQVPTK